MGFYVADSEENLIRGVAATKTINTEDTVTSCEIKKKKHKDINKTGVKRKCMDSLSGKYQRKLIRIKRGNSYPKVVRRSEQKHCYVLHRKRPSGQTM